MSENKRVSCTEIRRWFSFFGVCVCVCSDDDSVGPSLFVCLLPYSNIFCNSWGFTGSFIGSHRLISAGKRSEQPPKLMASRTDGKIYCPHLNVTNWGMSHRRHCERQSDDVTRLSCRSVCQSCRWCSFFFPVDGLTERQVVKLEQLLIISSYRWFHVCWTSEERWEVSQIFLRTLLAGRLISFQWKEASPPTFARWIRVVLQMRYTMRGSVVHSGLCRGIRCWAVKWN